MVSRYMDNIKDDIYYLNKIIDDIQFVIQSTENMTLDEFNNNEMVNSAVNFKFIQISENALKLSKEFVVSSGDIPWHKIKGLRNKIVHDYGNVVMDKIYDTIKNNLPVLLEQLLLIVNNK